VRAYAFDTATNRTGLTTYNPDSGETCQTTTAAGATTWTYDTADRVTTSGYMYDVLGRTLTMPGSDTAIPDGGTANMTYHVNDMVRTVTQGSRTTAYTLDVVSNRIRSWTDDATGATVTKVNHFVDGDSPAWTDEGGGSMSRVMTGLADMVGTQNSAVNRTWMITNLHGDLVAGIAEGDTGLTYTSDYDETGKPRKSADAGTRRYGWLGASQRSGDVPAGLVLMGARIYSPGSARFLSTDPIRNGNSNDYEYCRGDMLNCTDTSGMYSCDRGSWITWQRNQAGPTYQRRTGWCKFSNWEVKNALSWGGAAIIVAAAIAGLVGIWATKSPWGAGLSLVGAALMSLAVWRLSHLYGSNCERWGERAAKGVTVRVEAKRQKASPGWWGFLTRHNSWYYGVVDLSWTCR